MEASLVFLRYTLRAAQNDKVPPLHTRLGAGKGAGEKPMVLL